MFQTELLSGQAKFVAIFGSLRTAGPDTDSLTLLTARTRCRMFLVWRPVLAAFSGISIHYAISDMSARWQASSPKFFYRCRTYRLTICHSKRDLPSASALAAAILCPAVNGMQMIGTLKWIASRTEAGEHSLMSSLARG